ncbi:MAG: OmpH family outer membrane protein [Bacteroidales bacterium]
MKNILKFTVAFFLVIISSAGIVQAQKFAHVDFQKLVEAMPERQKALQTLQEEYKEAQDMIEEMSVELNQKYMNAQKNYDSLSEMGRQMLEEELMSQQQRIQEYQTNAEKKLSERREELLNPVIEKAQKAIDVVAEEEGYIYVFDVSEGSQVLYFSGKSENILPEVKKQLGITGE